MAEPVREETSGTPAEGGAKARRHIGLVVGDRMDKTRVVAIQRLIQHPRYKKYVRRDKKLYVHDEENASHAGDRIEVVEVTRPLSRMKRYRLVRIVEKAK